MKLKPKKSNPPIPKLYLYPITRFQTNSWAKFQPQSENQINGSNQNPKSSPFRVDFRFFFNYSSNLPTLMQYTTRTEPRSKETKNSNTSPRRPPKKNPIHKEGNVIDGGEIVNVEKG